MEHLLKLFRSHIRSIYIISDLMIRWSCSCCINHRSCFDRATLHYTSVYRWLTL